MQNTVNLIIQLVSGAMGGNLAGGLFKKLSLGTVLNSIIGILGGGLGGQLLNSLGFGDTGGPGTDIWSVIGNILGGGVGGGILMAIIGVIKKVFSK
jgi:uncharacterized membrane protein YeaQ/YmgE (transglycosylase-associated protein family)